MAGGELADSVARALDSVAHRGPDGRGVWIGPGVALGHCRLAIISPEDGQQPILDEATGVALTFNGEIYNYRALRQRLASLGHRFRTQSDSEVLLRGYLEFGVDVLAQLSGIFAFCVFDPRDRSLFGARDHFGVKPLYLWRHAGQTGDDLICASEIKAILACACVDRALSLEALYEYLIFGFVSGPATLFRDVQSLLPGHAFTYRAGTLRSFPYFTPREIHPLITDPEHAVRELESQLQRAVTLQLVSDVPLGILLSGGVDSGLIAALGHDGRPGMPAFTLRHAAEGYDETPYARRVAERYHLPLSVIDVSQYELPDLLRRATWFYDDPLIQTNTLGLYLLCREINACGVKVVLSGEGGDELFGGYARYGEVIGQVANGNEQRLLLGRNDVALPRVRRFWPEHPQGFLYRESVVRNLADAAPGNRLLLYDQQTFLTHFLQRQDRMGMAFGVEIRVPFLDHELANFANSLHPALKFGEGFAKQVLKQVAESYLPADVVHRSKEAFDTPVLESLRGGSLNDLFKATVNPRSRVASLFDVAEIDRMLAELERGESGVARILWQLLTLETWMQVFEV